MSRYIEINGVIEVPDEIDHDAFCYQFIRFCEDHHFYFGGGTQEIDDKGNVIG